MSNLVVVDVAILKNLGKADLLMIKNVLKHLVDVKSFLKSIKYKNIYKLFIYNL